MDSLARISSVLTAPILPAIIISAHKERGKTVPTMVDQLKKLRVLLAKIGLMPLSMKRSKMDRRVQGERRTRSCDGFLVTEGADRRFEPERRRFIDRRAGKMDFRDLDGLI